MGRLKIDDIIAHVDTERNNPTERLNLMLKEGEGIIMRITRPGISQRA